MTRERPVDSRPDPEDGAEAPLWRFMLLAEFQPPPSAAAEQVRVGLRSLLERLRGHGRPDAADEAEPLERLAATELAPALPEAPARDLRAALEESVSGWTDAPAARLVLVPPHGPAGPAVRDLAEHAGLAVLDAPAPQTLLAGDGVDVPALDRCSDTPLVVPELERFFLRHPAALPGFRDLLGQLALRRAPTLVSCSSWTFAWLQAALGIESLFPDPIVLAPLDSDALARWLGNPAAGKLACTERNGRWVLWPGDGDPPGERSDFLQHLASEARGNPTVARAVWSAALRRAPHLPEPTAGAMPLGVVPWSELPRPGLRRAPHREEIALLHALLLHGELPWDVMASVLPFGEATLARRLADLHRAGLAEPDGACWRIAAEGYPVVRREILSAGLPPDGL